MNNPELNTVKGNILIVDDNPANLRLLSNILNDYGYELRCVTNGQMALTTARWFPPDLILLDIRMPGMDGYEVCSKLKADEKTRDIPVIFISVLSDVLDKVKAFSVGGVDYITKLFEPEEVLARVENQLSIRRLSKQLREQNARLQEEIRVRREAEEKFTRAFRSSPDAIAILTLADGCYIEVNDSFCRISGYSPDEAIGSTLKELNLWVKPQDCLKLKHQLQQTKAIRNWECDFRTKTGKVKTMLISAEIIDLNGQACILTVSKDITERKAAQQALKASEAELRALLAALPDVVLVIDAQGRYLKIAPTNPSNLYKPACELFGKTLHEVFEKEQADTFLSYVCKALESQQTLNVEYSLNIREQEVWFAVSISPMSSNSVVWVARDITQRKQREETLRESQRFIQQIAESSPNILYLYDLSKQRNIYTNRQIAAILGYTPEEIQQMGAAVLQNLMHPDDFPKFRKHLKKFDTAKEDEILEIEYRVRHAGGEWRTLESRDTLFSRTDDGKARQILGTATDITQRKQAEVEIRLLLETTQAINHSVDVDSALAVILRLICTTIGWDFAEAWIPANDGTVLEHSLGWYECDSEAVVAKRHRSLEEFRRYSETVVFAPNVGLPGRVWSSGCPEWLEDVSQAEPTSFPRLQIATQVGLKAGFGVPILANNQVLAVLVFFKRTKSTEYRHLFELVSAVAAQLGWLIARKKAQAALCKSEERLHLALQGSGLGLWDWNIATGETYLDPQWKKMLGYEVEEIGNNYQSWERLLHPEDLPKVMEALNAYLEGATPVYNAEFRMLGSSGEWKWIRGSGKVFERDESGVPLRMTGTNKDISDRIQAERALTLATERLQHLLTSSPAVIYSSKISGDYAATFVSENVSAVVGYQAQEFIEDSNFWGRNIHPEDAKWVFAELPRLLENGYHTHEYRFLHKDGTYRWVYDQMKLVKDEAGNPIECVGYWVDITERKQTEERLRLLERAIAASSNGIVLSDAQLPDCPVIFVNPAFESITGYSAAETIGKNCRFLQGTDKKQPALEELRAAIREERECRVVLRNYHKDGTLFWNEFSVSPVRDTTGRLTHYVGIQSDITQERTAIEALTKQFSRTLMLKQITEEIRSSLDPSQIFTTAANQISHLLTVDRCLIHTYVADPEPRIPIVAEFVATGVPSMLYENIPIVGNPHAERMLAQDAAISSPDVYADPLLQAAEPFCRQTGLKSMLVVRTSYQGEPNGAIGLHQCDRFRVWTLGDISLLESVAAQLGIAIAQASLLEQEKQQRTYLDCQNQQLQQQIRERQLAEVALRQSEAKNRAILWAIPDLMFRMSNDAIYLDFICNSEVKNLWQSEEATLCQNMNFKDLPPEVASRYVQHMQLALDSGKPQIYEQQVLIEGKLQYEEVRVVTSGEEEVLFIVRDISDRKQAEIALQQQISRERLVIAMQERIRESLNLEEVLKTAVEEVRQFLSTDRTIIYRFNPGWSGVVAVESVGEDWMAIMGSDINDPCFGESYVAPYQQGRILAIEDIHAAGLKQCHISFLSQLQVRANLVVPILQGNKLWGLLIAHHCRGSRAWHSSEIESLRQLSVQLAIAIQQSTLFEQAKTEIIERKQAEEKLRQSEQRFRDVSEAVGEYLWEIDSEGIYTFITDRVKSVKGYPPSQLIGHKLIDFVAHEDIKKVEQILRHASRTKSTFKLEHRNITPTREIIWEEVNGIPLLDNNGNIIGFRGTGLNITQRKQAEAALQQAAYAADAANRAKSEFLASMSHELRTPLNAILGFTQIMTRDSSLSGEQQEYLGIINRSGEHLLELINDILEMSKIEAGRITFNESSFDLINLLESLEEMFRLKVKSKSLKLEINYASNIPQYVRSDESKLRQVLINLLGNAIKFTEQGSVVLRVSVVSELSNFKATFQPDNIQTPTSNKQQTIRFEVEDTGLGIAPEEINKLFEAFGQTETGRKSQQGTGLGLPISRKFVQLMGGDITVSSSLGKGTVFAFDIHISLADATEIQTKQLQPKVIGLAPDQPEYRILVVEDRLENRILLVKLLTSIGFDVREAENGQDAITLWESWEPHLIWMDMRMPVMDGYEAIKRIKGHVKGHATVIIALTASAFEEQRNLILSAGCNDFIRKPFRDAVIFEKMAQHLGVRYIYESLETLHQQNPEGTTADSCFILHASSFQDMPTEWVEALYQAAIEADAELILSLTEQISTANTPLSSAISDLVDNFQFEQITNLIEEFNKE